MDYYIAEKQILTVEELKDIKTPGGSEMVKISFVDGTQEIMTKKRLELISSEEMSDSSSVQELIKARVASTMYGILHEYGIKWGEINAIFEAAGKICDNGYTKASNIKFGVEDRDQITLISINNILLENGKSKEDNNSSSS